MAIVKVGTYRNPPVDITDYEAIVSHLEAYTRQVGNQGMILTEWTNTITVPKIAMGSYISHGGVLYVVEDEDYALPALSSDGTYYIRVAASGETLVLDYITDLTGYVWNAIYNGLYHPDGSQVLPYSVIREGSAYGKRKILNLASSPNLYARTDYQGSLYGNSLTLVGHAGVNGNVAVGGTLGVTGAISGAECITTNGPNKPVDNSGAVMPNIGIGGFTFGYAQNGNITLPPFGTIMVIGFANTTFRYQGSGLKSGGSVFASASEYSYVFAWRIA